MDIDDALAEVVTSSTEPALGAIRLAWWREALERLDHAPPPPEPRLQAAAKELIPRGLRGAELGQMEECWGLLIQSTDVDIFMRGVAGRGPSLFRPAARLLGVTASEDVEDASHEFASIDLGRRGIMDVKGQKLRRSSVRDPRATRPLTALAAVARRDMKTGGPPFEPEATPARAWALIRYWMTGRR